MTRIAIDPAGLRESARTLRSVADALLDVATRLGAEAPAAVAAQLATELSGVRSGVSALSIDIAAGARDLDLRAQVAEETSTRWWSITPAGLECCCRLPNGQLATIRTKVSQVPQGAASSRSVTIGGIRSAASSASGPGVGATMQIGGASGVTDPSGSSNRLASGATITIGGNAPGMAGLAGSSSRPASGSTITIGGSAAGLTDQARSGSQPASAGSVTIGGSALSNVVLGADTSFERGWAQVLAIPPGANGPPDVNRMLANGIVGLQVQGGYAHTLNNMSDTNSNIALFPTDDSYDR